MEKRSEFFMIEGYDPYEFVVEVEYGNEHTKKDEVMVTPWIRRKDYGVMECLSGIHRPISNMENYMETAKAVITTEFDQAVALYKERFEEGEDYFEGTDDEE